MLYSSIAGTNKIGKNASESVIKSIHNRKRNLASDESLKEIGSHLGNLSVLWHTVGYLNDFEALRFTGNQTFKN